ncbi:biotin--[acetyl-CoA-carboxylase] ligase [Nocardioides sp.]|uniref:biotin--[acetyl-CoA-carboxylase] ligase n=1 Tax=Nocardioides sp. TaxID=35761 RepID=UPI002F422E86
MNAPSPRAPLDLAALQVAAGPPWTVRLHEAAGSTNALAAAAPERGLVLVADHQTAGRGRLGREWVTPPGAALTFSAVVDPVVDDEWWPLVPLVAGYAVARTVRGSLKWPNDVLLGERKVCGILVERVHVRAHGGEKPLAVIGIGINVDQAEGELPVPTATSLALATGPVDRTVLLGDVLRELRRSLGVLASSPHTFVAGYRPLCTTLERDVRVDLPDGSVLEGRATGIDDHGRLVVSPPWDGSPAEPGMVTGVAVAAGDVVHVRSQK